MFKVLVVHDYRHLAEDAVLTKEEEQNLPIFEMRITLDGSDMAAFKELVQRATNCWDNAPPEIKHFADMVIHGKPLQNYYPYKHNDQQ